MGLINPFWICVNMLLRATGLSHGVAPPITTQSIVVTLPPSSFFSFVGSTVGTWVSLGLLISGWALMDGMMLVAGLVSLIGSAFVGNEFSVPMSNAANQAETLLQQNLSAWQSLAPIYQTTANQVTFVANFNVVWNAYVQACVVIAGNNPTGNAEKALIASVEDRMRPGATLTVGSMTFTGEGKYDWFAYYLDPIQNSPLPGNSMPTLDNPTEQLSMFVLSSLTNSQGTGAADIAATQVPAILGTGNETQFQFQGVISSQKPFRDWLTEVLNCCLGFYAWEFGQLKLGIRTDERNGADLFDRRSCTCTWRRAHQRSSPWRRDCIPLPSRSRGCSHQKADWTAGRPHTHREWRPGCEFPKSIRILRSAFGRCECIAVLQQLSFVR
jgi:uncharacterized membrane protein